MLHKGYRATWDPYARYHSLLLQSVKMTKRPPFSTGSSPRGSSLYLRDQKVLSRCGTLAEKQNPMAEEVITAAFSAHEQVSRTRTTTSLA